MSAIAVLGAGAWGTALAVLAARRGHEVELWTRSAARAEALRRDRENARRLPGIALPERIRPTARLAPSAPVALLAVPAQAAREVCAALARTPAARAEIVVCCKGFERGTGAPMSAVVGECLPEAGVSVLTGPSFADEAAAGQPTAAVLAHADAAAGRRLAALLGGGSFRLYRTDDVIGAQVGGAVKNVVAIACGIAAGRGFGENARAALIARGLAEAGRLAAALGGRADTLAGLSGVGDLALTCASVKSRNYAYGLALGGGRSVEAGATVEGAASAAAIAALAARRGVDMPIVRAVDSVLRGGADLSAAIRGLLERPPGAEDAALSRAAGR